MDFQRLPSMSASGFHPVSSISEVLGDEISVIKVMEESKCPDPKKL